jgi:hypothetical protein
MDNKVFKEAMLMFLKAYDFKIDEIWLKTCKAVFESKGITDEQLQEGIINIISNQKKADMYGKPAPADMLGMMGIKTKEDEIDIAKQKFLTKVGSYLSDDFISSDEKKEFNESLSEFEKKLLASMGGISELWRSVHTEDGYRKSISSIKTSLEKQYEDGYKHCPKEEVTNIEMKEKINKLLSVKKI